MYREYIILLLLAHIVGEFYVLNSKTFKKEENSLKTLLIHSLSYYVTMLIIAIPVITLEIIIVVSVTSIVHMIIELLNFYYCRKVLNCKKWSLVKERNIFFVIQALHLASLIIISYIAVINKIELKGLKIITKFFDTVGLSEVVFISWLVTLLLIHKPANIAISKFLALYKPRETNLDIQKDNNAGRFIGTVERIIMVIFISLHEFAAIGLVLTAKSIARYDRISRDKDFAEYYLLGTLISVAIVVVVSFIL